MKLCSACLLGINCRYDGSIKPVQAILDLAEKEILIPVCPDVLFLFMAGEIIGGKLFAYLTFFAKC